MSANDTAQFHPEARGKSHANRVAADFGLWQGAWPGDFCHGLLAATTVIAVSAILFAVRPASADNVEQQARNVLKHNRQGLVTVTALSKLDMSGTGLPIRLGGLGEAQESSCSGLVIDSSGLTVVSYTALNPMEVMASAVRIKITDDDSPLKSKSELSRIRMRLDDGTELPARLTFKDKELDLAFLMPDPKEGDKLPAFSPIALTAETAAQELDTVVTLTRHGKDFGCQPVVDVGRITSVIAKPRPLYDLSVGARPGTAVFLPDGRLLGLVAKAGGGEDGGMMSLGHMELLALPTAELAKLAEQAQAAEKKSSTK